MVRRLIVIAAGLFLLAGAGAVAQSGENTKGKAEFRFDVRETNRTETVVKDLSHEIDLWHDAALKRNGKRMRAHEKRIFDLIEADIQARDRIIYRYENEAVSSVNNAVKDGTAGAGVTAGDDVKDLRKAKQLVKAKEMLYDSIKRTDTFSNRYRLLGDYLEIVKRESRMNTVELAEDGAEINKSSIE